MHRTKIDLAWAAGLFDGEGCVSIGYVRPSHRNDIVNPAYKLQVKVTMGDKVAVKKFGAIVGNGSFQNHVARGKRISASYSWVAASRKAEKILRVLHPYLVTKLKEANVAFRFMALPDGRVGGKGGNRPVDPKLMLQRHLLYLKCCKLKPRWRFRKSHPGLIPEPPRARRKITGRPRGSKNRAKNLL